MAALVVEEVRSKLNGDAVQLLKGMGQQQALGLGVERAALHAFAVPGRTNFYAPVGGVDVHVSGHAHCSAGCRVQHGKRAHAALCLQVQPACNFSGHGIWCRDRGVPEVPQFAIAHRIHQIVVVTSGERHQRDMLIRKGDGCDPGGHDGVSLSLSLAFCLARQKRARCSPTPPPRPTSKMPPMLA